MRNYVFTVICTVLIISSSAFAADDSPWRESGLKNRILLDWQPCDAEAENTIWELPLDLKKLGKKSGADVSS